MKLISCLIFLLAFASGCVANDTYLRTASNHDKNKAEGAILVKEVVFESQGVKLTGNVYQPKNAHAAVVLVHGSDPVPRMTTLATLLAENGLLVLTYDKRGVGESGGIYVGPSVGTNNISVDNLTLLAKDASAAINIIHQYDKQLPIGLVGASQAGWIIPMTAHKNPLVDFMVLFSSPTITTLEQLRFQFYTNGREDFWDNHTDEMARAHTENDPDKYQFTATDPKDSLNALSIPGLWLFGEKDIQVPVKMCMEQINTLKAQGKPYEYVLFSSLGHNTNKQEPIDIALHWIQQQTHRH
ncbi:lysophospholipase [Pseudoalteromonas sp. SMS1]|uniref:alpha/beta hydrolase family protein n=1 Tax=Pseudoalteromonas sp. SMS1 TaxID=2908894 RepID=UPI001F43FE8B|nr:alpha/beta hydrolase [Pseudoalteromonas sp. SMS1]MCF2855952.1 lysophospholipase [Pseudoalteromonas sp. SMS1]